MSIFQKNFYEMYKKVLEPQGFVLINTKRPYFVRAVNGEILHIIDYTCTDDIPREYREGKNYFILWGGIVTVYCKTLTKDLSKKKPPFTSGMRGLAYIYENSADPSEYDSSFAKSIGEFTFIEDNEESLIDSLEYSIELTEEIILPVLDSIQTLSDCVDYYERMRLPAFIDRKTQNAVYTYDDNYGEEYIYIKTRFPELAERMCKLMKERERWPDDPLYKKYRAVYNAATDEKAYTASVARMEKLKEKNIAFLRDYGINI